MLDMDFSIETLRDGTRVSRAKAEGDLNLLALFLYKECRRPYVIRRVLNWLPAKIAAENDRRESHRLGRMGGNDVTATIEDGLVELEAKPHVSCDHPEYCDVTPEDFKEVLIAWMKFLEENGLGDPPEMANVEPFRR